jgi:predicted nucleotidyltransferase
VLAGPGLEEIFLSRAIRVDVAGVSVPVISPEDLVVAKILAGRAKDLDDIQGVLRERLADLDLTWIRTTLAQLEDALGQSDLVPLFEDILARATPVRG